MNYSAEGDKTRAFLIFRNYIKCIPLSKFCSKYRAVVCLETDMIGNSARMMLCSAYLPYAETRPNSQLLQDVVDFFATMNLQLFLRRAQMMLCSAFLPYDETRPYYQLLQIMVDFFATKYLQPFLGCDNYSYHTIWDIFFINKNGAYSEGYIKDEIILHNSLHPYHYAYHSGRITTHVLEHYW